MSADNKYIFTSERLGFREWCDDDAEAMTAINTDPEVMEFFPSTQSSDHTKDFIKRMKAQYQDKGYCYFAVDLLEAGTLIGFIGISEQKFESDFTPCNDIGWRLKPSEWYKGYATEGAKRCLEYAFDALEMEKIYSIAPAVNKRSEAVMSKIDMRKVMEFNHPLLADNRRLERCVLYEIERGVTPVS
ncbi:MAG: N-acetyltransferase [Sphingobacteriales bacterium]|nr:MAG: N-acetyltransferase [Sphingobacteriales bacterium]